MLKNITRILVALVYKTIRFFHFFPSVFFTYILVVITWLFFRVKDMNDISMFLSSCLNWTWGNYPLRFLTILLGFSFISILFDLFEYRTKSHVFFKHIKNRPLMFGILTIMFVSVLLFMINSRPLLSVLNAIIMLQGKTISSSLVIDNNF